MDLRTLFLCLFLIAPFPLAVATQTGGDDELRKLNSELTRSYSAGDHDAALRAADKIVALSSARFGKDHLATASALKNRGFVQAAKGDLKGAEESLENAAAVFQKQKDLAAADAGNYAELLESLAGLKMRRDLLLGEKYLEDAVALREKAAGPNAGPLAFPLASLANISFWKRDYKASAAQYKRALDIFAAANNTDSPDFTTALYRARCTYRKAKMEQDFQALEAAYGKKAEFTAGGPGSGKAKLINAGVVNGKALNLAKPPYPAAARQSNAEGLVEVDVLIDEEGTVVSACTSNSPHSALAEASEIAAYNSKFSPTTLQGKPVKVSGRITYKFSRR